MPQRAYTESKRVGQTDQSDDPLRVEGKNDASVSWHMQVELKDPKRQKMVYGPAERFNVHWPQGWRCNALLQRTNNTRA